MEKSFSNTVSEIKRLYFSHKYRDELLGEWGAFIFYRWISFYASALLVKYEITATTVTWVSLFLCFTLPLVLLVNPDTAYIYLGLGGVTIAILDCVDGNIARVTNTTSLKGQYLDFITDIFYRIFLYTVLGFLIQNNSISDTFLSRFSAFLCLIAALLAIIARLCRDYAEKIFLEEKRLNSSPDKITTDNNIQSIIFSFLSGLDLLLPVFILIAGIYGSLFWVMVWVLFYSSLDFTYTQFNICRRVQ